MGLFNDPVRGQIAYSPEPKEIGNPVLVVGWREEGGQYLVLDGDGRSSMWEIENISLDWRWVEDRTKFPSAGKDGPGWLDLEDMDEVTAPDES